MAQSLGKGQKGDPALPKRHCSPPPPAPRPVPAPEGSGRVLDQDRGREGDAAAGPEAAVKDPGSGQGRRSPLRCCPAPGRQPRRLPASALLWNVTPYPPGAPACRAVRGPRGHPTLPGAEKKRAAGGTEEREPRLSTWGSSFGGPAAVGRSAFGVHFRDGYSCPLLPTPKGLSASRVGPLAAAVSCARSTYCVLPGREVAPDQGWGLEGEH